MDPAFWLERWRKQEIGFHQTAIHDLLQEHWPALAIGAGARVFVPLCGKSLDMAWLARQGHTIVGSELSEIAVDEFFAERGLTPATRAIDGFVVKSAGAYEIWCGDFFELPHAATAGVAGIYDRAALIAFPPSMQVRYAEKLKALVPGAAPMLLITLDYDQSHMQGPPFAASYSQVEGLFSDRYDITELARRGALDRNPRFRQRGLTELKERVYVLRRT